MITNTHLNVRKNCIAANKLFAAVEIKTGLELEMIDVGKNPEDPRADTIEKALSKMANNMAKTIKTMVYVTGEVKQDLKVGMWVPVTPAGSICAWLAADTEQGAIDNLLKEAAHMPFDGWNPVEGYGFKQRGYTICQLHESGNSTDLIERRL